MEFVSFTLSGTPNWGVLSRDAVHPVPAEFAARYPDLKAAIAAGVLADAAASATGCPALDRESVEFLPVIPAPGKIVCIGMNYLEHIREMGREPPEHPALFVRFPDSLVGHDGAVRRPRVSTRYDFEGELAVIIGKPARYVGAAEALSYVAGYSCFMDGSVRDYQMQTSQFTAGKNFPRTGALGPSLMTADQVPDPSRLRLETRVSGEVMQRAPVSDLWIDIPALIEYVSTIMQLMPGDVIATGTPSGVGSARKPPRWLVPGDCVEVDIAGVGLLRMTVEDEDNRA